jgi:hypothetical protein
MLQETVKRLRLSHPTSRKEGVGTNKNKKKKTTATTAAEAKALFHWREHPGILGIEGCALRR